MSTVTTAIVVLVVLTAIVAEFTSDQDHPYRRQADELLSKAERSFYDVLRQAVGEHGIVFAKVRVADVLATECASKPRSDFDTVQSKHFDFVICSSAEVAPKLAIELDDSSHRDSARARHDALNEVAQAAGLPLLRIPAQKEYAVAHLKEQLAPHLGLEEPAPRPAKKQPPRTTPSARHAQARLK